MLDAAVQDEDEGWPGAELSGASDRRVHLPAPGCAVPLWAPNGVPRPIQASATPFGAQSLPTWLFVAVADAPGLVTLGAIRLPNPASVPGVTMNRGALDRSSVLGALIELDRPLEPLLRELAELPWDSDRSFQRRGARG
jgi:hypothetical protein